MKRPSSTNMVIPLTQIESKLVNYPNVRRTTGHCYVEEENEIAVLRETEKNKTLSRVAEGSIENPWNVDRLGNNKSGG